MRWGSLQRSPDPLAGFKQGPASKGKEGKGKGRGRKGIREVEGVDKAWPDL